MIIIKSAREINLMREAGKVVAQVFKELEPMCVPGISTQELANKAEQIILAHGCIPTFKGYGGFPGAICVSINETLVHGIPSSKIILKEKYKMGFGDLKESIRTLIRENTILI